jgi:hypothetical protein
LRNGEGIDGRFANSRVIIQTDFPSIDQAMELTKQLREQILKADRSQDELARYGIVQPMMSGRSR